MNELIKYEKEGLFKEFETSKVDLSWSLDERKKDFERYIERLNDGVSIYDISFEQCVRTADKQDYLFAIISGMIASLFDIAWVGKSENAKEFSEKSLKEACLRFLSINVFELETFKNTDLGFDEFVEKYENKTSVIERYDETVVDFSKSLSITGLLITIISRIFGYRVLIKDNKPSLTKINNEEVDNTTMTNKVVLGFVEWLILQAKDYRETGKFKKEADDLIKLPIKGKFLYDLIKELAKTDLCDEDNLKTTKLFEWMNKTIFPTTEDEFDSFDSIKKQLVPVMINRLLIKAYFTAKVFVEELKKNKAVKIEEIKYIELKNAMEKKQTVFNRLDTVSTAVFFALDLVDSAVKAKISKQPKATFISMVNLPNAFHFVASVNKDITYINKIKTRNKEKVLDELENRNISIKRIELRIKNKGLNKIETRILYSLQRQMVLADIKATKSLKLKAKKDEWLQEWIKATKQSINMNKIFEEDEEKVYQLINSHTNTNGFNEWLYIVLMDLIQFEPYYNIEETNKYKSLKQEDKKYLNNVFLKKQNIIDQKELKRVEQSYHKNLNRVDKIANKGFKSIAGNVLVPIAAASAAYAFAPYIAVFLAGSIFPSLSGAALTSASLAYFGGGAIAAGGFGMAGGTMVIAGGGALAGLTASGATSTALVILTSPEFTQKECAKLLTRVETILLEKQGLYQEAEKLQESLENSITELEIHLSFEKDAMDNGKDIPKQTKEDYKNQKENLKTYKKTNEALKKILTQYKDKH